VADKPNEQGERCPGGRTVKSRRFPSPSYTKGFPGLWENVGPAHPQHLRALSQPPPSREEGREGGDAACSPSWPSSPCCRRRAAVAALLLRAGARRPRSTRRRHAPAARPPPRSPCSALWGARRIEGPRPSSSKKTPAHGEGVVLADLLPSSASRHPTVQPRRLHAALAVSSELECLQREVHPEHAPPPIVSDATEGECAPGFFLPLGTARYTAVTAVTAGVR
jgi:hypothetical protein